MQYFMEYQHMHFSITDIYLYHTSLPYDIIEILSVDTSATSDDKTTPLLLKYIDCDDLSVASEYT